MSRRTVRANAKKSAVRAHVEHPFAHQKGPMGLVIRTIGLARHRDRDARQHGLQHEAMVLARQA